MIEKFIEIIHEPLFAPYVLLATIVFIYFALLKELCETRDKLFDMELKNISMEYEIKKNRLVIERIFSQQIDIAFAVGARVRIPEEDGDATNL